MQGGSICWQAGNYVAGANEIVPLDILFYPLFAELGLKLRNRIIWHFGHGLHARRRLSGRYETILWFTKGDDYVFNLDPIRVPQTERRLSEAARMGFRRAFLPARGVPARLGSDINVVPLESIRALADALHK